MKLATLILLSVSLQLCARGYSQNISLSFRDAKLETIFQSIEAQSHFHFIYSNEEIDKASPVDINVKNASIEKVLDICFAGQKLSYKIDSNNYITVTSKKIILPADTTRIIRGIVTDENNVPLQGATVMDKKSGKTTSTNSAGEFILSGITGSMTLVISNIGFATQQVRPGNNSPVIIRLSVSVNKLDDVQVIAYGTVTKRFNTGDITTIKSETIENQPVSNPLEAIEGRVPGLFISQNTGVPGGGFTVQLRGQNSISSGNNPLYIVDGVPYSSTSLTSTTLSYSIIGTGSPLNNINPSDIESIEILKDADATSIYGSRGANGVILISTKKGKAGKTKFDLNSYSGFGKVTRMMDLLNTKQYLQMRHEAFSNDGETPGSVNPDYDLLQWDTTRYTNWQKLLFGGAAIYNDLQGSISGGGSNTQFLIGGGFHQETTVFPGDFHDQKGSAHININHISPDQKFQISFSANYLADNSNLFGYDLTSHLILAPDAPPVYDSSGKINWAGGTFFNPLAQLLQKYKARTNNLIANSNLSYLLFPGFRLKVNLGYTTTSMNEIKTSPLSMFNPADGLTTANTNSYFSNNNIETWIIEPQINYNPNFRAGKLDILFGSTFQQDLTQGQTIKATGYSNQALMESISAAASLSTVASNYAQYRYNAFFGRVNYNLYEKYIINVTARRDGSSRFGPGKQFANFGAAGFAWIFTKEKAIQNNLSFLSFGKLRISYGTTGNDQIGDYQYLSAWAPTSLPYQGMPGLQPANLFNPDYSWEINRKIQAAIELGFLKDRILLSAGFYRNRSSNQLVGYPLAANTGFTFIQSNLPALVQNTGGEFELNTTNIKSKNFRWNSSFNLSIPRNKLIAYPGLAESGYSNYYEIGKSLFIQKLFHFTGVDPNSGTYQFQSLLNGNNTINPSYPQDLQALKQVAVSFYGGFLNQISYKGFQLDLFFQFVKQTGRNFIPYEQPPGTSFNQPMFVLDRWKKPGDITNTQEFTQDYGSNASTAFFNYQNSDRIISDASFIRLKNISVSYQVPGKWKNILKLNGCRIYVHGQNLLTITKYEGLDPESQGLVLPPLRALTMGIQLTF